MSSDLGLRLSVMTLQPVMALSGIFFAVGTVLSAYLIFVATGAGPRSVLTAASLLTAACSCFVSLMVLRAQRFRDRRSRLMVGVVAVLASGWLLSCVPTWISTRGWWAVAIGIWAVVIMLATMGLQWLGDRLTSARD